MSRCFCYLCHQDYIAFEDFIRTRLLWGKLSGWIQVTSAWMDAHYGILNRLQMDKMDQANSSSLLLGMLEVSARERNFLKWCSSFNKSTWISLEFKKLSSQKDMIKFALAWFRRVSLGTTVLGDYQHFRRNRELIWNFCKDFL